jgi:glycosyltransferase involved in cell wall biosynthesis
MTTRERRKLLMIVNTIATFGGGEKYAFDLRSLVANKFDVSFTNPTSKHDVIREDKVKLLQQFGISDSEIHDIGCYAVSRSAFGTQDYMLMLPKPMGLVRLASAIRHSDVVYCITNNPFLLFFSVFYSRLYSKKFIFGVHQPLFAKIFKSGGFSAFVYRRVLGRIKYFHVLNAYERGLVNAHYPNAVTYFIPGFAKIDRNEPRRSKEFVVMFAGRQVKYEKGIDLLCEIIEKTIKKNRSIKFKIVGAKGDGEQLLQELAGKYQSNVKLLGFVSVNRVMREWADSALALFTSRNEELRYFPLVFLESQSFGLPLVTFMGKGAYSVMIDGEQGKLVSEYDTEKASEAIVDYYNRFKKDKNEYFKMKQRISSLGKKLYGERNAITQIAEMFLD